MWIQSNTLERERALGKKRGEGGVVRGTQVSGRRQSITLSEGSQASPARPSGKSSLK
jgi:hypothetical protein